MVTDLSTITFIISLILQKTHAKKATLSSSPRDKKYHKIRELDEINRGLSRQAFCATCCEEEHSNANMEYNHATHLNYNICN